MKDAEKQTHKVAATMGYSLLISDSEVVAINSNENMKVLSKRPETEEDWKKIVKNLQQSKITNHNSSESDLIIYADGGSRGNPGPSATGFVIMDTDRNVLEKGGEYLGVTTNNQAEYLAVKQALTSARKFSPESIEVYLDSQLVVNQMNGVYKVKSKDLWPIHESIKEIVRDYPSVTFGHVRREYNKVADAEVNKVLDERQSLE